jgi:hypothetical protein
LLTVLKLRNGFGKRIKCRVLSGKHGLKLKLKADCQVLNVKIEERSKIALPGLLG